MTSRIESATSRPAVIFDMDGVLVDSYQAHFESWRRLAEECGRSLTRDEFSSLFGRTSGDILDRVWGAPPPLGERKEMEERKERYYRDILEKEFKPMDGAADLAQALLEHGFLLAVGSSGPPENIALVVHKLGLTGHIPVQITGRDVTRGKPDPQVFLLASRQLGVRPGDCAVIEDAPAGIAAALAAKMVAVGLAGTVPIEKLRHAHRVVGSLRELTPQSIARLIREPRAGHQCPPSTR
ncbi:MAG TPA: HAD family phosphatase [Syntrophobacteraceae bacterium]|nr:HAD family phosphatase [Syntrophobacteraceae bacterium]